MPSVAAHLSTFGAMNARVRIGPPAWFRGRAARRRRKSAFGAIESGVSCAHGRFAAHSAAADAASRLVVFDGVSPLVPRMARRDGALAHRDAARLDRADAEVPPRARAPQSRE